MGIVVLVGLYFLMNTKFGFWIIGGLMSLLWGLLVAVIVYDSTGKDMIWTYVSWGLVTLVIFALHFKAKNSVAE
jgi:multisubunit Na+/H+ antiporter MnhB subunit